MKTGVSCALILLLAAIFAVTHVIPHLRLVCLKEKTTNTCQFVYLSQGIP